MRAVTFAAVGNVTRRLSDLRLQAPKVSGGWGLQLAQSTEEQVKLTVDSAVTQQDDSNLYVGLSEVF